VVPLAIKDKDGVETIKLPPVTTTVEDAIRVLKDSEANFTVLAGSIKPLAEQLFLVSTRHAQHCQHHPG